MDILVFMVHLQDNFTRIHIKCRSRHHRIRTKIVLIELVFSLVVSLRMEALVAGMADGSGCR